MRISRVFSERIRGLPAEPARWPSGRFAAAVLAALVLSAACGPTADRRDGARIVLERAEREGYWRATYELGQERDHLTFQRPAAFYRETVWDVVTPGWRLDRSEDLQTLRADPGAASARVVVEFPVYTDVLAKEYEFFQRFGDGSVAIYTGHLDVAPSTAGERVDDDAYVRRLELVPRRDERLVVQGKVFRGRTVWDDPHGNGTYVYFGSIEPVETESMVAIVDPGAPPWLGEQLRRMLPRMFSLYADRFAEPLPWKPVVLFNFEDVEMGGTSSGGGTLTGLVQMTATGRAWRDATPETSEQLLYLVAHEASHLWNGQLHEYRNAEDSWMHEGSADAFADLALERAGVVNETRLVERRTEALNRCALGLRDGPLTSSGERRQFRNYYTCGEMIALWSAAAISDPPDPERLFDVWHALFERSDPADGRYDRQTYFEALASLGVDAARLDGLRAFVDDAHADPATALVDLLAGVGIAVTRLDRPLPALRPERAAAALRHLMADACDGRFSFYTEGRRFRTEPIEGCAPFSRELIVVAIEDHEPGPEGDLALEATARRCSRGESVTLNLEGGGRTSVPCAAPPLPEPAPLSFPALPPA